MFREKRAEPQLDSKNHPERGDMEPISLISTFVAANHRLIGAPDLSTINPSHRGNGQRLEDGRGRIREECLGEDTGEVCLEDSFTHRCRERPSQGLAQDELWFVLPPLFFRQGECEFDDASVAKWMAFSKPKDDEARSSNSVP